MARTVAPYGSWDSPLSVDDVARTGSVFFHFSAVDVTERGVFWLENRTAEGGRSALVYAPDGGEPADVTPSEYNIRSRVHEYGGGAFWRDGETLFFSDFGDGRLYRQDGLEGAPVPITPEPTFPAALRYADGRVAGPGGPIVCVHEVHEDGEIRNELVALPSDGSGPPRPIVSGNDFYAFPRPSPDGRRLAWTTWNDPLMPFEGTELWVGAVNEDGDVEDRVHVAGGPDESIFQPQWSPEGVLHFVSDRTGWWNLYRWADGELVPLAPLEADLGTAQFVLDMSRYAFVSGGRIACIVTRRGIASLELLEPASAKLETLDLPYTAYWPYLRAQGTRVAVVAGGPAATPSVVLLDLAAGTETVVRRSAELPLDGESISRPRAIEFPTSEGETAHGFFYPPANARFEGPPGEPPPLYVHCHGGPTSLAPAALAPDVQLLTSRGIAVVDVNYRGSTGYGRRYRKALEGRWGEADVDDCVAAARYLAETGQIDGERTAIGGGSAGGYTALCALAFREAFTAGVSLFGVADLETFAADTHKFESHYLDSLVGPYPAAADAYQARSPVRFADRIAAPLLLLQGLDDEVVPPSQAEQMIAALERNGVPYAYLAFEGEGHGFRREDSNRSAYAAILSFLAQVFGFELADQIEPLELANAGALKR